MSYQIKEKEVYADELKDRLKTLVTHFAKGDNAQFARLIDVKYQTVVGWLRPKSSMPGPHYLIQICEKLGIDANWLLAGQGEIKPGTISYSAGRVSCWNMLQEINGRFFDSQLPKLYGEAVKSMIDGATKEENKKLESVMKVIETAYELWCKTSSVWIETLLFVEDNKEKIILDKLSDKFSEDAKDARDNMMQALMQVSTLLKVFEEEKGETDGDSS